MPHACYLDVYYVYKNQRSNDCWVHYQYQDKKLRKFSNEG